ncbi:MAG: hypothetical protein R6U25_02055 [Alkalispirochaeta sp.]
MTRVLSLLLAMTLLAGTGGTPPLSAQDSSDSEPDEQEQPAWLDEPAPYDPDEFPQWARDLRRGEIIALGAFPVAMIISGIGYQLGRFTYQSAAAGELRQEYVPGFFSPQSGPRYNSSERVGLIVSGALISVGVAVADFVLGRRETQDSAP